MRCVQILPDVSVKASGLSYAVARLCTSLIEEGTDITLATLDLEQNAWYPAFVETFPLGFGPRRLGTSPALLQWLYNTAHQQQCDLFHSHSLWMMPAIYAGWVTKTHRLPLVVSPHGTMSEWAMQHGSLLKRVHWPALQRPALRAAACFHATAESEYRDIRRLGFRQPVAIIPNGIDIPVLSPRPCTEYRTLLFLGRITPKKGLDILLAAWSAVQAIFPEWRLRIVGPGKDAYLAQMRRLAAKLRLERIVFSGPLYGDKKWAAYREADLFVLPTYSENFGIAIAEALATGTPTIVSKGAPWADLVSWRAGWWIEIGVPPLVACLRDALASDPHTLAEMGARGRDRMEAEFSWELIGRQMVETYHWVLHGGCKPEWVKEG